MIEKLKEWLRSRKLKRAIRELGIEQVNECRQAFGYEPITEGEWKSMYRVEPIKENKHE